MTPEDLAKAGTEHGEQRALFAWLNMAGWFGFEAADDPVAYDGTPDHKGIDYCRGKYGNRSGFAPALWAYAIPNGGKRDQVTAAKLKNEGVKPGVPDVFLPFPFRNSHVLCPGLFIEMKRSKSAGRAKGRVSDKQEPYHAYLRGVGYAVVTCYTWREAADAIKHYAFHGTEI